MRLPVFTPFEQFRSVRKRNEGNSRHVASLGKTLKIAVGDIRFFNRTYLAGDQHRLALIKDFKRASRRSNRHDVTTILEPTVVNSLKLIITV